jgi:hypothetical protein
METAIERSYLWIHVLCFFNLKQSNSWISSMEEGVLMMAPKN